MRVDLTKPITAHGEEVSALELREPTGGDIVDCGYPFSIGNGEAQPNAAVVGRLISRLAAIPPSSVAALSARDFNACLGVVLGFFGE